MSPGLASQLGSVVEDAFVSAICQLLNVVNPDIPPNPMGPRLPYAMKVTGDIAGPVEAGVAAGADHPHVSVETEILGLREEGTIGARAAADVEDPSDRREIVVTPQRLDLPSGEGRLPETISPGKRHDAVTRAPEVAWRHRRAVSFRRSSSVKRLVRAAGASGRPARRRLPRRTLRCMRAEARRRCSDRFHG